MRKHLTEEEKKQLLKEGYEWRAEWVKKVSVDGPIDGVTWDELMEERERLRMFGEYIRDDGFWTWGDPRDPEVWAEHMASLCCCDRRCLGKIKDLRKNR